MSKMTSVNPHEIRVVSVPKRRRKDGLLRFAKDVQSQSGEDGIIEAIFAAITPKKERFVVDVGAWDGKHLSNTYALLVQKKNWHGLLIEADEERYSALKSLHDPLKNATERILVSCQANSSNALPMILKKHKVEEEFDLLSIDVDGADYWLFQSCLESGYRPLVCIVEFNPTMPHELLFIQERSDSVRHGSSLSALIQLASSYGYRLAETTTYNAFFVQDKVYSTLCEKGLCFSTDTIADLHDFTMGTSLYQLYDGTLKLTGCKKLLWHRLPLDENKIQHLDKSKRFFPYAPPSVAQSQKHLVSPVTDDDDEEDSSSNSSKEQQLHLQSANPTSSLLPDATAQQRPPKRSNKKSSKQRARRRRHATKNNNTKSFRRTKIIPALSIALALGIGIAIRRSRH